MSLSYISNKDKFFNEEQRCSYKELVKFINLIQHDSNTKYFLFNGPAGSGKTFVLCSLINAINELFLFNFKILAPTHKACSVIRNDLRAVENFTEVNTIAKFLGYKEEIDENGKKIITYTWSQSKCKEKYDDLLIIDECSMVSKEQLEVLQKTKIHIIFVGDKYQINPVGEEESSVFNLDFFGQGELVKNERIKDKVLGSTIIDFRESVQKNFLQKKCIENIYKTNSRINFDNKLIESFKKHEDSIYISYTNASVDKYNDFIRKELFGVSVDAYVQNEVLTCDTYFSSDYHTFYTSEKVLVDKCCKKTLIVYNPSCICSDKNFKFMEEEEVDKPLEKFNKCTKCNTPTSVDSYKKFEFWCITLKNLKSDIASDEYEETFYKPVSGMNNLYPILYKYRDRAKESKNRRLWASYYSMINKINVPLSYSYAITVHKAQGSGYDNVFMDMENMMFCNKEYEKLRLLYTAISRARLNVLFIKK